MPMNITPFTQSSPMFPRRAGAASRQSDTQQPAHTFIQGPPIHLRMGENILCSGDLRGQTYTAEYTAGSTDEDPVVRISGTSSGGKFDFTCRIRDIDPANASYAELAALHAYLRRTGAYQSGETGALPTGMGCGDIAQKRNYLKELESFTASASKSGVYPKFGPAIYRHAQELLTVYQGAAQGRETSQANAAVPSVSRSGGASQESAFSKYLDVDAQRRKMRELPPGRGLPSVYMQFA